MGFELGGRLVADR
ncbi:Protein of unknown function [Propionibacterium freudenreichii subsp. freudenreichii]|uniref:Uncharacterized protein n=1 Tax=Propionibacterium freudenreichii subsp. freudenreichii TaxID=66712 RepID=A0A068VTF5_PROFF|nr:Protein of unknown function [Propionibacterium freudenreichii subsp. freudenreichii]CEG95037.1 Protein of unknown function [Propionibacterium freudenreichii]CEH00177.1 Protein of unknown function [Propionibacterium freudenreichii]CEH02136.1 Protein of unknown function [Propionibacterium freudenreichii]CEH08300.1 Protein of unknown function [Propionibacterium freudenreichii]